MNLKSRFDIRDAWTGPGEEHHQEIFGEHVLVTRLGEINIVHTDKPTAETIQKRIREVLEESDSGGPFEADCPLCREMQKHPYDIVYHENDDDTAGSGNSHGASD